MVAINIMPATAHLCASQLSGAHPTVTFNHTRVYTMLYGRPDLDETAHAGIAIESLELLDTAKLFSLFLLRGENGSRYGVERRMSW